MHSYFIDSSIDQKTQEPYQSIKNLRKRLYHDVNVFVDQVPCDHYRGTEIVLLLPKCLRGAAYMWYQSNQKTLDADLTKCMKALIAKFNKQPQETSNSATQSEAPHTTPQLPVEYHKCTVCSISFSSISRLLSHSQMATCGKSFCNHCEEVFDSKNKLHDHIRSRECQKSTLTSATKSIATHKSGLTQFSTPERNTTSDANIAFKKAGIKYSTHVTITPASAAKSITPHKPSLLTLTHVESTPSKTSVISSTTPPPTYRVISLPPPIY